MTLPSNAAARLPSFPALSIGQASAMVLVADDDDDNLLLISYALEMMAVNFIAAKSGAETLTLAHQFLPSLILLDIRLADMSGIEVFQQLHRHPSTAAIPIVAVTALARACDRDRILAAGFADYLLKPYQLEDLTAIVHHYLFANSLAEQPG